MNGCIKLLIAALSVSVLMSLASSMISGQSNVSNAVAWPRLRYPTGLALDGVGNLYIADAGAHSVFKKDLHGKLSVVAGTDRAGYSGDASAAIRATLNAPHDLAFDSHGNLYIADTYNHRIRRVTPSGIISTVAGTGAEGYGGERGPATNATLNNPQGIAFDQEQRLLIADTYNFVVVHRRLATAWSGRRRRPRDESPPQLDFRCRRRTGRQFLPV
jgi:sugar lactone lactonase YvrE